MAGLTKQAQYQYDINGYFIRKFDSIAEINKEYNLKKGRFYSNTRNIVNFQYRKMEDNTYICNKRVGRDKIKRLNIILNCKYCTFYHRKDQKEIEVYNLLGEKLAEFKNIPIAMRMLNIDQSTIFDRLESGKQIPRTEENRLIFKYKQ